MGKKYKINLEIRKDIFLNPDDNKVYLIYDIPEINGDSEDIYNQDIYCTEERINYKGSNQAIVCSRNSRKKIRKKIKRRSSKKSYRPYQQTTNSEGWIREDVSGDGRCALHAVCKFLEIVNLYNQDILKLYETYKNDLDYHVKLFYEDPSNALSDDLPNEEKRQERLKNQIHARIEGLEIFEVELKKLIDNGNWGRNNAAVARHFGDFIIWYWKTKHNKDVEVMSIQDTDKPINFLSDRDFLKYLKEKTNRQINYKQKEAFDNQNLLILVSNGSHWNVIYHSSFFKN